MHQLMYFLGLNAVYQFGGGTIGHSQGIQAGATANRVACETIVRAVTKGVDLWEEGSKILADAAKDCLPLAAALTL